jgi:hypothetical protein
MTQVPEFLGLTAFLLAFNSFRSFALGTPPARRSGKLFLLFSDLFFSLFMAIGITYGLKVFLGWNALIMLGCLLLGGAFLWPIREELRANERSRSQSLSISGGS